MSRKKKKTVDLSNCTAFEVAYVSRVSGELIADTLAKKENPQSRTDNYY